VLSWSVGEKAQIAEKQDALNRTVAGKIFTKRSGATEARACNVILP